MKSTFTLTLVFVALFLVSVKGYGQSDSSAVSPTITQSNTLEQNQVAETQLNKDRKDNADALSKEYKAKAREARRVEKDASNASLQARRSVKMEKKAQRARRKAERQNEKAVKAAEKSDNN